VSTTGRQDRDARARELLRVAFWLLVFVNLAVAFLTVYLTWRLHTFVGYQPSVLEELFKHIRFSIVVPVCITMGVLSVRSYLFLCDRLDTTGELSWDGERFWAALRERATAAILILCVLGLAAALAPWSLAEIEDKPGYGRVASSDVYYTGIESELGLLCTLLYGVVLLTVVLNLGWAQRPGWPALVVMIAGGAVFILATFYVTLNLRNAGPAPTYKDLKPWAVTDYWPREGTHATVTPSAGSYLTLPLGLGLALLGWFQWLRISNETCDER
jgi:hypothetical protein